MKIQYFFFLSVLFSCCDPGWKHLIKKDNNLQEQLLVENETFIAKISSSFFASKTTVNINFESKVIFDLDLFESSLKINENQIYYPSIINQTRINEDTVERKKYFLEYKTINSKKILQEVKVIFNENSFWGTSENRTLKANDLDHKLKILKNERV